jgi:ADP-heptose:LPS heptosyltransferase
LLVKQSERLGNIILMNAGISGLRNAFPECAIDLLLPAAYAEIMAANKNITGIIAVAKREYIVKPWLLAGLLSEIRKRRYDIAINCSDVNSRSTTEAAYTLLSGAKITAGWKTGGRPINDIEVAPYADRIHASQMYKRLFSGIFGQAIDGDPFFRLDSRGSAGSAVPIVGVNCGGRGKKRIALDTMMAIGEKLDGQGVRVEFVLGPEEEHLRGHLANGLPGGCGLLPLMTLKDLMDRMGMYGAFISSDTGPMHLAWALGIPTVAIFVDSEAYKFGPLSKGSLTVDGRDGVDPTAICGHVVEVLGTAKAIK